MVRKIALGIGGLLAAIGLVASAAVIAVAMPNDREYDSVAMTHNGPRPMTHDSARDQ